jgi:hypothetical protein
VKETKHKIPHIVLFPSWEMSRIGKGIEREKYLSDCLQLVGRDKRNPCLLVQDFF